MKMRFGPYTVEISKPEKVLFPEAGLTKADLAGYYRDVAEAMLGHVRSRPLMMHRFPDGIEGKDFYQKQVPEYFPDWVRRRRVAKEGGSVEMVLCENAATLVYLADQACITPHVWLSRVDRLHHPDRLIFDLDPSDDDFAPVRAAAGSLAGLLSELGLVPYVMTTGSRGLHVVAPLDRGADFDAVREFAQDLADLLAEREPDRLTTARLKEDRGGRLFLDTARNAYAQTAVAPYAVRARPGAPVATPLDWDELDDPALTPTRYTLGNVRRRLGQKEDPWKDLARHGRSLDAPRKRLEKLRRRGSG